jgi:hypothetical protein
MRLVLELDSTRDLVRVLEALEAEGLTGRGLRVTSARQAPPRSERRAILARVYEQHTLDLPDEWTWDRDAAHDQVGRQTGRTRV